MKLFNRTTTSQGSSILKTFLLIGLILSPLKLIEGVAFAGSSDRAVEVASWLKVEAEVFEVWTSEEISSERVRFTMADGAQSAGDISGSSANKKVLFIFPKKSSAYNTALSTSLRVFADRGIFPEIEVVLMEKDNNKRLEVIAAAEAEEVDLIFATGSSSAKFAFKNYWGGRIPVVTICAKDPVMLGQMPTYNVGSGSNMAFTSLNVPVGLQGKYLKELKPNLRNVAVLFANENKSAIKTQYEPLVAWGKENGVNVLGVGVSQKHAAGELAEVVPSAVEKMRLTDSTLKESIFWITGSTSVFREIATVNAHSSTVPVLSVVPDVVQAGNDTAVMSIGVGFQSNAQLAAIYGVNVLTGKTRVGDLPVGLVEPPDIAISFLKAREIGMKVPFSFLERASTIYGNSGVIARSKGKNLVAEVD
tara:strand:+ start:825 stop:2081 length:1257 start_codon:yes stop_codon:yes gene_type:complete